VISTPLVNPVLIAPLRRSLVTAREAEYLPIGIWRAVNL
jgi:hypothetical protein